METPSLIQLDYAPPMRRRNVLRHLRRLLPWMIACAALWIGWCYALPSLQAWLDAVRARSIALETCLNHTMPTTQPVFDEGGPEGAVYLDRPMLSKFATPMTRADMTSMNLPIAYYAVSLGNNDIARSGLAPASWHALLEHNNRVSLDVPPQPRVRCVSALRQGPVYCNVRWHAGDLSTDGVLYRTNAGNPGYLIYLGPLATQAGERRLVNLTFDQPAFICGAKKPFHALTWPTDVSFRRYTPIYSRSPSILNSSDLRPLKLFAAQRDPKNPSLLTFKYRLGPTDGLIDARLQNDGTVVLSARN